MSVERYINDAPDNARSALRHLRDIIRAAAEATDTAPLTENLKWGQPSFAPQKRMGTPIRLSWSQKSPERVEMLVHCQTSLVEAWRHKFGDLFDYDGTRAVHIDLAAHLPEEALHIMAVMALTYHKTKG
ncbi:DUF1801 domain-containing protein [Shimia sagamensis]|uniref:YdhG-like domain-containing protein n=1 Tax=Shimia sagamensis TaxID=1566352 RepID=A0ABY1NPB1_9RHOB|nr:DUF1801 domain-containing protein [Shimia sagamensis]SMP14195.1 protein of unknown function (DU1801) [Shimia sagamensis]